MKTTFSVLLFILIAISSFAQFNDTTELNAYIRDTIKDRRPDKVTAAQLQKSLFGIVKFIPLTTPLNTMQVGYGSNSNTLTGKSTFTFNDATNALHVDSLLSQRVNIADGSNSTNLMPNSISINQVSGSDNVINITTNNASFKRLTFANTNSDPSAGSGALFLNDIGAGLQYYVGSSVNAFVPNGVLLRSSGTGGFNIVADAGPIAFGKSSFMGAAEFARFTTDGKLGIGTQTPIAPLHIVGSTNGIQQLIKLPASQTQANPIVQIQDSNGDTLLEIRAQYSSAGTSIFAGRNAGISSTGDRNTGIGDSSLANTTTGGYNSAFGSRAMRSNTTGGWNVAVGHDALSRNTTGNGNVSVGEDCLSNNTTGTENIAVGGNAQKFMVDGAYNTAIGSHAGEAVIGGSYNTFVGAYTSTIINATRYNRYQNTMIGYRAGFNCNADTGNVLIGYDIGEGNYSIGNNKLFIANNSTTTPLIYGEFDNAILALSTTNGKFGIRTKTPQQALHVKGQVKIDTITTGSNTDSILTTSNGVVRRLAPGALNAYSFSTGLTNTSNTVTNNLSIGVSGGQTVVGGTASGNNLTISSTTNATKGKLLFGSSAYDETNNRLGLGLTSPNQQLEMTGNLRMASTTSTAGIIYKGTTTFIHNFLPTGNTGGGNTFVGESAGNLTMTSTGLTGSNLVGVGYQALTAITTGYSNTAIGSLAMNTATTALANTAVGYQAFYGNTATGSSNTAIGYQTLYAATSAGFNTVLGHQAGRSMTIGANNILLGYKAGYSITTTQHNIIIGNQVDPPSLTDFGQLNIGNVIYGTAMYNGSGMSSAPTTGNIGIGLTTPTARLHLAAGTSIVNTAPFKYTAGTNLTVIENGAKEFDGNNEYLSAGGVRYTLAKTLTATATLDFGSTAAGAKTDLTVTVTGAADGDVVSIGVPNGSTVTNGAFTAWVSASNTITVRFTNNDPSTSYDPTSGTFRVSVLKY